MQGMCMSVKRALGKQLGHAEQFLFLFLSPGRAPVGPAFPPSQRSPAFITRVTMNKWEEVCFKRRPESQASAVRDTWAELKERREVLTHGNLGFSVFSTMNMQYFNCLKTQIMIFEKMIQVFLKMSQKTAKNKTGPSVRKFLHILFFSNIIYIKAYTVYDHCRLSHQDDGSKRLLLSQSNLNWDWESERRNTSWLRVRGKVNYSATSIGPLVLGQRLLWHICQCVDLKGQLN